MQVLWRKLRDMPKELDGQFLLFLLLLCHVKLAVKALALLLLLWRHRAHWSTLLRRPPVLSLFYPALVLLGGVSAVLAGRFAEAHYAVAFAGSEAIWITGGLLSLGMWAEARYGNHVRLERSFEAFLWLNAAVSFAQLARIILETGALNPYRYQGNYQKYFINTGDYIKGISFDSSTTNAVLCALGVLLFAQKRRWPVVAACLAALVLAASNLVNVLVLLALLFLFCFRSDRAQKSLLALCLLPFVIFWARISPQNTSYMQDVLGTAAATAAATHTTAIPAEDERRDAIALRWRDSMGGLLLASSRVPAPGLAAPRPELPSDNIHSAPFQHRDDSGALRAEWRMTATQLGAAAPKRQGGMPGKAIALLQTVAWLRAHPDRISTGSGPASFSSKMAFKATGLGIAGQYPASLVYRNADFARGHLALFLSYFAASEKLHSVVHSPNSVYDQLMGEYGALGLLLAGGYLGYLLRARRRLRYSLPLLGLLAVLLGTDYWMEQLSVIPLFEFFFFVDLQNTTANAHA